MGLLGRLVPHRVNVRVPSGWCGRSCQYTGLASAVDDELPSPSTGGPVGADEFVDQGGRLPASAPGPGHLRAGACRAPHGSRYMTELARPCSNSAPMGTRPASGSEVAS